MRGKEKKLNKCAIVKKNLKVTSHVYSLSILPDWSLSVEPGEVP